MLKSKNIKDACLIRRYASHIMNTRGNTMRKVSSLICTATAMLLSFGVAMAEETTETEQAKPTATTTTSPEDQSKPKEVTTDAPPSQDTPAKPNADPACD